MENEKKKILIVEDDIFVSGIYQVKFSQEGYEVTVAINGADALKKMESFHPDVILLDIIMPQMDGTETLKRIKSNGRWKEIPIIMLTNISEKEKIAENEEMGIEGYLIKSHFTPSEVFEKINSLLKK